MQIRELVVSSYRTYTLLIFICIILFVCAQCVRRCRVRTKISQACTRVRTSCRYIYTCVRVWYYNFGLGLGRMRFEPVCQPLSFSLPHTLLVSVSVYVLNTFRKNHFGIYSDLINVVHRSSSSLHRGCHRLYVVLALDAYVCRSFTSN